MNTPSLSISHKKAKESEPMQCASCGICIGEDYDQKTPEYIGDKPICSYCNGIKMRDEFIQVDSYHRLLPDGALIFYHQTLREKG